MSNQQVTYTINLNNNVRASLRETEEQALKLDSVMSSLNDTFRMFGFGFAGHAILNEAKEWIQATADYENAVNRIKFASDSLVDGATNIRFIGEEVDKFKIPLQKATDDYGKFLAMVQGSGMASDKVRELHDNLLLIGKIKHLDDGQLSAGVMNLGKMLEAGALDARHLRPLEMQLSGIGKFIADELGVSIHELAVLRNKGKLTDIDPQVIVEAIKKQAESLGKFLPESLLSLQSELNETDNAWLSFKQSIIEDIRPELIGLFGDLNEGIHWLKEHRDSIIKVGSALIEVGKYYLEYKAIMLGVNILSGSYNNINKILFGTVNNQISATTKQAQAYDVEKISIDRLVTSIERLNYVQNAQNATFITGANGVTMANTIGNRYQSSMLASAQMEANALAGARSNIMGMRQGLANTGIASGINLTGGALGAASRLGAAASGVMQVAVVFMAAEIIKDIGGYINYKNNYNNATDEGKLKLDEERALDRLKMLNSVKGSFLDMASFGGNANSSLVGGGKDNFFGIDLKALVKKHPEALQDQEFSDEVIRLLKLKGDYDLIQIANSLGFNSTLDNLGKAGFIDPITGQQHGRIYANDKFLKSGIGDKLGGNKDFKIDTSSKIRGNSVTNINIDIKELIGMNNPQFSVKNMDDMDKIKDVVGEEVVKILGSAVNDSQLVKDRH